MTDLATLLADATWLRSLAFRLAGPDAADDALQHAWLAHRTNAGDVRDVRSWFGTVLRNFGRRRRRDEALRRQHERTYAAARATASRGTDELVARMELQRRIAEAVLALAEPYRGTVLAHCFDGRTTKQIAEQTGEPWATVRSRLARGIEQLRESLRRDRADWRDGLALAVFGVPSARLRRAPGVTAGATAIVFAAVLSASALLAWLCWPPPPTAVHAPSAPVVAVTPAANARQDVGERSAGTVAQPAPPDAPAPPAREVAYTGQLLDPVGEPLAGVGVFVGAQRIAITDDSGRFAATLPAGEHRVATDEQHCLLWAAPLRENAANRFVATRCVRVTGTVVDDAGQRIDGARILYRPGTPTDFPHPLDDLAPAKGPPAIEAAAGEFDCLVPWLAGASLSASAEGHREGFSISFGEPDEPAYVFAFGDGKQPSQTEPREVRAFRSLVHATFVLPRRQESTEAWRPWVIEGLVLDGEGRPVAGAVVSYGGLTVPSRVDGTFTLDTGVSNLWVDTLVAAHPEFGVAAVEHVAERWRDDARRNPHETLRLATATRTLRGRVVDARGEPVVGRCVRVVDPWAAWGAGKLCIHEEAAFRTGAVSDAQGAFTLVGLLPRAHRLAVLEPATMQCIECGPFADGAADVVLTVASASLQPEWRARVIDVAGRAIAGATVNTELWKALGGVGSSVFHTNTFTTDADGRVTVPAQCSEGVRVTVEAPGFASAELPREQLREPTFQLGRIAYLRYRGSTAPESVNQRRLALLDAYDRALVVEGPYCGMWWRSFDYYLTGTKSGVLCVSELATTLVIYTDDGGEHRNEAHRVPIRLVAGELTTID
jgi:RNA polymerase sigma factor (sigma-70 family)